MICFFLCPILALGFMVMLLFGVGLWYFLERRQRRPPGSPQLPEDSADLTGAAGGGWDEAKPKPPKPGD